MNQQGQAVQSYLRFLNLGKALAGGCQSTFCNECM